MHPSLMTGCQLHQGAVTFYFHAFVCSQGECRIWSGKNQGISDSKIHMNLSKGFHQILVVEVSKFKSMNKYIESKNF